MKWTNADNLIRPLVFLFFLTAGFTWVSGPVGEGLLGRLTLGDVIGALIVILAFIRMSVSNRKSILVPVTYRSYLPLLAVYLVGVLLSQLPGIGGVEFTIHVFIFAVSLALLNLLVTTRVTLHLGDLLDDLLLAGGVIASIGLLHFFLFPQWFGGSVGGLSGTFRNSGQAGSFFGTYIALIIPAFLSGLIKLRPRNAVLFALLCLAMVFTFKRAALIGVGVGLVFLVFSLTSSKSIADKRLGLYLAVTGLVLLPAVLFLYAWGFDNVDNMSWRVERKFGEGASEEFAEGFLLENIVASTNAFLTRPILGVGIGNVAGVFTEKYEIHSTYLKVLASGGILGVLTYCWFLMRSFMNLWRTKKTNPYGRYVSYFIPMAVGLVVSWAYTYHLRKREFWILMFVVTLASILSNEKIKTKAATVVSVD